MTFRRAIFFDNLIYDALIPQFDHGAVKHFLQLCFVDFNRKTAGEKEKRLILCRAKLAGIGLDEPIRIVDGFERDIGFVQSDV